MEQKTNYDLIILGAGPAGMTAAIYAARKQIDTLIISEDVGGQTTWTSDIENYPGFLYISGTELVDRFHEHLRKFEVRMEFGKVSGLAREGGGFLIDTHDGRRFSSRSVIVATGKQPRTLDVPGEARFKGKGVTYCATCDGPLFEGMDVAVVGGGNSGVESAVQLMKICPRVYLIERLDRLRADEITQERVKSAENVEILTGTVVTEILGTNMVEGITVRNLQTGDERKIDVSGVFVEVGLIPSSDFARGLLHLNEYGEIPVDCGSRTGVPGLFAAGDVTDVPEKQIICAAGDGAKAALGAYSYLVRLPPSVASDWGAKPEQT
mgnify:CR=1 FL=1